MVGTFLNSLLRHGDRVTVACQAQLVNVIGLLRSEEGGDAWKQTIAYPFEQMRRLATGQILQVVATSDRYDSPGHSDVPIVDATASYDAETGRAAVFVANRSLEEVASLEVDLRGIGGSALLAATTLHAGDGQDRNSTNRDNHGAVVPGVLKDARLDDATLTAQLPPLSWTVFEVEARRG